MDAELREQLIETVKRSPAAVAAKDRRAWVGLFAALSAVEDPVGSRPHVSGVYDPRSGTRGPAPLERFFDTFIAPNTIEFDVVRDIVCDLHVVRDLTIRITLAEGVTVQVPMHLVYELEASTGEFHIQRLAAHWELWPMIRQLLGHGLPAVPVLGGLGWRMARLQGPVGLLGFSRGLLGVGQRGKEIVHRFVDAFNDGHAVRLFDLFTAHNRGVAFPVGRTVYAPDAFAKEYRGHRLRVEKLLAAGDTVSATLTIQDDAESRRFEGVAVFEFDRRATRLRRVRCYWDALSGHGLDELPL